MFLGGELEGLGAVAHETAGRRLVAPRAQRHARCGRLRFGQLLGERLEPVAVSVHRQHVLRLARIRLDLGAQPADRVVDGALFGRWIVPGFGEQGIAGERRAGVVHQRAEQATLPSGERTHPLRPGDHTGVEVHAAVGEAHDHAPSLAPNLCRSSKYNKLDMKYS